MMKGKNISSTDQSKYLRMILCSQDSGIEKENKFLIFVLNRTFLMLFQVLS